MNLEPCGMLLGFGETRDNASVDDTMGEIASIMCITTL